MWTINLPLRIRITKKKERYFSLNLNQYRNANYFTLDKAKKNFHVVAKRLIREQRIPFLGSCTLEYTLYPRTSQTCDVSNVCSIVDKFFADSLVSAGVLSDDNYNVIAETKYKFGHIDRENPRVEVVIRSPDHSPSPKVETQETHTMKIQTRVVLSQADLNQALREYLAKHNYTVDEKTDIFVGSLENSNQGEDYELIFEPPIGLLTAQPSTSTRTRRTKAEPKEAMAKVRQQLAAQDHPETAEDEEVSENEDSEDESQQPADEATDEIFDHSPKTPEEEARQDAELNALVAAREEKAKQEKQQASAASTPRPLFSKFTRPKN